MTVISTSGQDPSLRWHRLPGPSTPLTDAGVPAAPRLGTEHAGKEDTQLAVDQGHIPASEDLRGEEAEMEA